MRQNQGLLPVFMTVQALLPCRMSLWQRIAPRLIVTLDTLIDFCDPSMQVIAGDLGYLSVKTREDNDRDYGKQGCQGKGCPLDEGNFMR